MIFDVVALKRYQNEMMNIAAQLDRQLNVDGEELHRCPCCYDDVDDTIDLVRLPYCTHRVCRTCHPQILTSGRCHLCRTTTEWWGEIFTDTSSTLDRWWNYESFLGRIEFDPCEDYDAMESYNQAIENTGVSHDWSFFDRQYVDSDDNPVRYIEIGGHKWIVNNNVYF